MTRDEMLQDLAYARTLAEEGRRAPLVGGAYFVLFGVLLTLAYAAHWAIATQAVPVLPREQVGLVWLVYALPACLGPIALRKRTRSLPGGASVANRVDRTVWQGVLIAILAVVIGSLLRTVLTGDFQAPNAIMAAGFGLYGVAIYVTAKLSDQRWLGGFAWLAWIASLVMWYFIDTLWIYLLAAGASVIVLLIPGVVLMRREPKAPV